MVRSAAVTIQNSQRLVRNANIATAKVIFLVHAAQQRCTLEKRKQILSSEIQKQTLMIPSMLFQQNAYLTTAKLTYEVKGFADADSGATQHY